MKNKLFLGSILLNIFLLGTIAMMWTVRAYAFNYYGQEYSFTLGDYFMEYLRGE